jgi:hypothetical protein
MTIISMQKCEKNLNASYHSKNFTLWFHEIISPNWGKDGICKLESPFALNVFLDNFAMKCKRSEKCKQYFRSTPCSLWLGRK